MITQPHNATSPHAPSPNRGAQVRDVSGYEVFGQGDVGAAHALAHRMLDSGRLQLGHRLLGEWLASHQGQGSDWVHLQFHMAVFELALDDWHAAYGRFMTEVLPTAASTAEALTDAPALLWRLALSAPGPTALPWQPLRRTALACMDGDAAPFVQLHHLLAFAGAGDAATIRGWLQRAGRHPVVERFGLACAALADRSYAEASLRLQALSQLGGSHAQRQLFVQLAAWAEARHLASRELHALAA